MTTATATRKVKKHRFILTKQQLRTCITLFLHFFAVTAQLRCEKASFTFYGGRKQARTNFFLSLSKLECGAQEIHLHLHIFIELE